MNDSIFLMMKDPENECRDLIFQRDGDLKIRVICVEKEEWTVKEDELQFFADNQGERLLFETVDYSSDDPALLIEAIRWYGKYIGNPEMEIEADF